jgi:hypothetical protein
MDGLELLGKRDIFGIVLPGTIVVFTGAYALFGAAKIGTGYHYSRTLIKILSTTTLSGGYSHTYAPYQNARRHRDTEEHPFKRR